VQEAVSRRWFKVKGLGFRSLNVMGLGAGGSVTPMALLHREMALNPLP
jgi:hypothetical protein